MSTRIAVHPLTPERWPDLETLFGTRGACGGCWCMWWRWTTRKEFDRNKGEGNRRAFRALVLRGETPGLLAYEGDAVVGWCALGPRESLPGLARSRILGPVDERPVWSVSCFFVRPGHRRKGVSGRLLRAAIELVRQRGGTLLEGYPHDPSDDGQPAPFVWTGLRSAFARAGFREVARRSPKRPIMRRGVRRR